MHGAEIIITSNAFLMKFWTRFSYLVLMDPAPTAVALNAAMDFWIASSCASLSAACNYKNISRYFKIALLMKRSSTHFLRRLRTIKRRHVRLSSQIICSLTLSFLNTLPPGDHSQQNFISCARYKGSIKLVIASMLHLKTTFHKYNYGWEVE